MQKKDSEIEKLMKEEHERAQQAEKQKQKEKYEASVRYQLELERQLEVSLRIFVLSIFTAPIAHQNTNLINFIIMKTIHFFVIFFALVTTSLFAQQNVGINTNAVDPSAALQINSKNNNQGLLIPGLTTTQRLNIGINGSIKVFPLFY